MSNQFVGALNEVRAGISLPMIANVMAKQTDKSERGLSGNLYRLLKKDQTPKRQTVVEIADALAELKNLSAKQAEALQERLLNAAHPAVSQAEQRSELRPKCERALSKVNNLSAHDIASILDVADVANMKLIIAASENGEVIAPLRLSPAENVIPAGRAEIHIKGEVTQSQREALEKAAELIEAVLKI